MVLVDDEKMDAEVAGDMEGPEGREELGSEPFGGDSAADAGFVDEDADEEGETVGAVKTCTRGLRSRRKADVSEDEEADGDAVSDEDSEKSAEEDWEAVDDGGDDVEGLNATTQCV